MQRATHSSLIDLLKKQKYQIVGKHSAVKKCRWLHESLVHGRPCYKQKFYGIASLKCLQMTPTLICNLRCRFCWRVQPEDLGLECYGIESEGWEDPDFIIEESIRAQRRILSGYKSQVKEGKISHERYEEALNPKHAAISLDGEPTLYPYIGDLIEKFHKRDFTTFLVTNGTQPDVLSGLKEEHTQLYVSLYATDEKEFVDVCKPLGHHYWKRIIQTLEALTTFKCLTVIRLTLVKGLNMQSVNGYAKLILKASPTYVEPKAFMYVGNARKRLGFENMPSYSEIRDFSSKLAEKLSYNVIDSSEESRVVLLSKLDKPIKLA
ncbi:MAG: 4-demethylwyosine synthase TYW1 [Candidatus Bathyarchaeia archaeon]